MSWREIWVCSGYYFTPILQIRWILFLWVEIILGWNRFLFPTMSKCSHTHIGYFCCILFCMYLASFSSLIGREIIHVIFTSLRNKRSGKDMELKREQMVICLLSHSHSVHFSICWISLTTHVAELACHQINSHRNTSAISIFGQQKYIQPGVK